MARPATMVYRVHVTGPLAPFADVYRAELLERGYTPLSTVNAVRQLARLSRSLVARGVAVGALTQASAKQFIDEERAQGYRGKHSFAGLVVLLEVLRGEGVLGVEPSALERPPRSPLLDGFERYLVEERGLSEGTVAAYRARAGRFLDAVAVVSPEQLCDLTARDVTGAVLGEAAGRSVASTQLFASVVRSFLRFCVREGWLEADLSAAALSATGRRRSGLPQGISRGQAAALLDSCDRRMAVGRRDYAVILMLLRLGLRASEVAGLTLDDIDWRAGELVVRGKRGCEDRLPLPADVGAAIAGYLRRGRPGCARREVFVRALAPIEPLGRGGVSWVVRRACRRVGLEPIGAHRLRHTAACAMVASEVPLDQIGQVLRHRSLYSTATYARVDVERLRRLAQPWPAEAQR